jgi:hypothetical protein
MREKVVVRITANFEVVKSELVRAVSLYECLNSSVGMVAEL